MKYNIPEIPETPADQIKRRIERLVEAMELHDGGTSMWLEFAQHAQAIKDAAQTGKNNAYRGRSRDY